MSRRSAHRGQPAQGAGFTLVEVLLAISLVGLIMAMAYGGFRASVRATGSGEVLIEQTNRLRISHQFVRRQLSLAQALIIEQREDDGTPIRFLGDRESVRFVAPMPGYLSYGGPYVQQLRLEPDDQGFDLIYYYSMLNGYQADDNDFGEGIVLIDGIAEGRFRFLGSDPETGLPGWMEAWEFPGQMPLAVSLAMDLDHPSGLTWPDLIAPVMLDGTAAPGQRRVIRRASDILFNGQRQ